MLYPLNDILQLLVVLAIGMIGPDIGNYMMGRVHGQLREIVQLPGLARLYANTGIRVSGTVVRLVAGVLTALVPRSGTLVLVF